MAHNYQEFLNKRQCLRDEIDAQNGAHDLGLSNKELKAGEILEQLKHDLHAQRDINLMDSLLDNLPRFKTTPLYDFLRKMPKGVLQHVHLPAGNTMAGFTKAFSASENITYSKADRRFKLIRDNALAPGYERVTDMVKERGFEAVQEEFRSFIQYSAKDMNLWNTKETFDCFEERFMIMAEVFFYFPTLRVFLKEFAAHVVGDNIQAVEVRNIFGLAIRDDGEGAHFEEELEFFEAMRDELCGDKDAPLLLSYIHTGVKAFDLSPDKVRDWFAIYAYALSQKRFEDLFVGFDMVAYEGKTPIAEMAEELFRLREEHPKANFILHSGESVEKVCMNVVDAILLNSKRLGHGVAVAKSAFLLELVKNHGVCIEANPISNIILGCSRDPYTHPIRLFINSGLLCTISSDDYLFWDCPPLSMDFFVATLYSDLTLQELKWLAVNSITCSYFSKDQKALLMERFTEKWNQFVDELIAQHKD